MMHRYARLPLLMFVAAGLSGLLLCTGAFAGFAPDETVQKCISDRVASGQNTGIAAAVADSDGVRYFFAGTSSSSPASELQKNTLFEIGSVTKLFTGLLLAQAVQQGEVRLDETIASLLPEQVVISHPDIANITLLDLATHTSGLPRMPANWQAQDLSDPYAHYDGGLLLQALSAQDPGLKNKGAYLYSNFGAGLLGYLLSRAAGSDFPSLVASRIAAPLGLKDSTATPTAAQKQRMAHGFATRTTPAPPWNFDALAGAGVLKSTPQDLALYLRCCMGLQPNPLEKPLQMTLEAYRQGPEGISMGLAWHIIETADKNYYFHDGGTGGFRAFVGFVTGKDKAKSGIVLLSNTAADVSDIGMHILDTRFALRTPRKAVELPAEVMKEYVGRFRYRPGNPYVSAGTEAELTPEGKGLLYACPSMSDQDTLFPARKDLFYFASSSDVRLEFQRDQLGKITGFVIHAAGDQLVADKIN